MWTGSDAQYARTLCVLPPVAPAPEVVAQPYVPAQRRDSRTGDPQAAFRAVWSIYGHVTGQDTREGTQKSREHNAAQRAVRAYRLAVLSEFSRISGLTSSTQLPSAKLWECVERQDEINRSLDAGFHERLFGHLPGVQAERKLLPAAYAAVLDFAEPTPLAGSGRETWELAVRLLLDHEAAGCRGDLACPWWERTVALFTGATKRRAA